MTCTYCGDDLDYSESGWALHYRRHIEELLTDAVMYEQYPGIAEVRIPDSWQGPRIQQLRGASDVR